MLKIGLIDVDSHNFPNLALMKIAAYHKAQGDKVEWWSGFEHYNIVYQAKVFTSLYSPDNQYVVQADEIITGGTGYDLKNRLPPEIEHIMPDYSLYGIKDTAYGFLTRGCPRACLFCVVARKEGRKSRKVADVNKWWNGQKKIVLLDPNLLACTDHLELLKQLADTRANVDVTQGLDCRLLTECNIDALNKVNMPMIHFAWDSIKDEAAVLNGLKLYAKHGLIQDKRRRNVYVLVNFNTAFEEDLYRIYKLREMDYNPYVMVFDRPNASKELKRLQRWVNNKFIWWKCEKFEDYQVFSRRKDMESGALQMSLSFRDHRTTLESADKWK